MIDSPNLGSLLRSLIREDVAQARLRTPALAALRALAPVGPELPPPAHELPGASTPAPGIGIESHSPAAEAALRSPLRELVTGESSVVTHLDERGGAGPARAPLALLAGLASPSVAAEWSAAGRLLLLAQRPDVTSTLPGGTAARAGPGGTDGAPADAARARPLVSVPPHSEFATDRLALHIKDAVEFSGAFYESHLAQWADDLRPRALLAHEPQSRWPLAAGDAAAGEGPRTEVAAPVLRQQLELIDTGRFVWRGDLWPGQAATLTIESDDASAGAQGDGAEARTSAAPRWRMRLELEFPGLGAVGVSLGLAGDTLDMALACDDPDAIAKLRGAVPALRAAIAGRELDLASVVIGDRHA